MIFGSWKSSSLYRPGSFMKVARELVRHKLHLVGVQEVMWEKGGISRAGFFFYGKENGNNQLGTGFLVR